MIPIPVSIAGAPLAVVAILGALAIVCLTLALVADLKDFLR